MIYVLKTSVCYLKSQLLGCKYGSKETIIVCYMRYDSDLMITEAFMSKEDEVNRPGYCLVVGCAEHASGWNLLVMNQQQSNKSTVSIQMAKGYVKRCSTLLVIREMQIQTTMRHYLTPVKKAIIKKSTNNKCWRGCGEKATLLHCWWECKLVQPLWRTIWRFLKETKNRATIWPYNPTPWHIQRKTWSKRMHPNVHCSSVYNSKDMEAT